VGMIEAAVPAITEASPVAFLFDLDAFDQALAELVAAFPPGTLHALAVKANPVGAILRRAVAAGAGLEAASAGELELSLRLAPPDRILLDSPAKTRPELERAIASGVHVNLDNLQEVARVAAMKPRLAKGQVIGLRVNPVVGAGTILSTSTAMAGSKFGVDLEIYGDEVRRAYAEHDWLTGLHVHVGSAGIDLDLLARGVARTVELAEDLESRGKRLALVDIGGGLPVDPVPPPFAEYVARLRSGVPALFAGRWRIATEMGRRVFGPCGILVSRVEYTKRSGLKRIATVHAGGDLLIRPVFVPDYPPLKITVHDAQGRPKSGSEPWDVAGPLCFSGDLIARNHPLPPIEPGDLLVVHGMGAYTFSHSTRYNSRPLPPIWGWRSSGPLELLRRGQTLEEIADFWDQ
jgi:diaminopimelate decarboxylase